MRFNCNNCSLSFDIDNKFLINAEEIACPQCQNLIPVLRPFSEQQSATDPTKTVKMTKINTNNYGELCLPANKRISLSLFSDAIDEQKRVVLDRPTLSIGRKVGDITIDDSSLSPRHAIIEIYDDVAVIHDLNSKSGTFVNNIRITSHQLKSADEVRLGKVKLLYLVTDIDYLEEETLQSPSEDEEGEKIQTEVRDVLESVFEEDTSPVSEEQQIPPGIALISQDGIDFKETLQIKPNRSIKQPDVVVVLELISTPQPPQKIRLKLDHIILGRGSQADVTIDDEEVSRKHAVIEVASSRTAYIRDLSSANGTYLNGDPINTSKLFDGDVIRIGSTEFKVSFLSE